MTANRCLTVVNPRGGTRQGLVVMEQALSTAFQKSAEKLEGGHRETIHGTSETDATNGTNGTRWPPKQRNSIAIRGRHTGRISLIGPIGRTYSRPLFWVAALSCQIHLG